MIQKINEAIKTLECMLGEVELFAKTRNQLNLETISIYNNSLFDMILEMHKIIAQKGTLSIDEDTCFMAFNNAYALVNRVMKEVM